MRTRPLGKTGLLVSEFALGTWGLSGDGYGPVDPAQAARVVARAVDMGVSLIETADCYGAGRMEALLGRVVREHPHVTVATRGGIDRSTAPPRKRFDAEYLRVAVRRSCKRLMRDRIEVYLLHNPTLASLGPDAAATLNALKADGLIGHWGVAAGDVAVARTALELGAEVLELAYNLFQAADLHRLGGELMVAGAGVLARSPLAYGLLSGLWSGTREFAADDHRTERWSRIELARRIEQLDAIRFLVHGDVLTLRGAAIRFVLANNFVSAAVLGPRSVDQLEQLVREAGAGPRYLPDEDLRRLPPALDAVGIAT